MNFLYPNEKKKALIFSYDDNRIHNRRLIDLFNHNGLKGYMQEMAVKKRKNHRLSLHAI